MTPPHPRLHPIFRPRTPAHTPAPSVMRSVVGLGTTLLVGLLLAACHRATTAKRLRLAAVERAEMALVRPVGDAQRQAGLAEVFSAGPDPRASDLRALLEQAPAR